MSRQTCRNFLSGAISFAIIALFGAGFAWAVNHHELNGTWQLVPERSELHGQPAIANGSVTIVDREGNIYVQRNFNLDDANNSVSTSVTTDARAKTTIKEPGFRSKAKWDGNVLKVNTLHDGITTVERFSLLGDGTLMEQVERTGRPSETFYFQRQ
jgi:hypothetical protein